MVPRGGSKMMLPRARGDKRHHENKTVWPVIPALKIGHWKHHGLQCRKRTGHRVLLAKSGLDMSGGGRCVTWLSWWGCERPFFIYFYCIYQRNGLKWKAVTPSFRKVEIFHLMARAIFISILGFSVIVYKAVIWSLWLISVNFGHFHGQRLLFTAAPTWF